MPRSNRGQPACGLLRNREGRDLVGLARHAAEREHARALVAGDELALLARADARERARAQLVLLAAGLQRRGALDHDVDLFLGVVGVVVLGVLVRVRREVEHLEPERLHSEPVPHELHRAAEGGVELVERLHRHVSHRVLPLVARGACGKPYRARLQLPQGPLGPSLLGA